MGQAHRLVKDDVAQPHTWAMQNIFGVVGSVGGSSTPQSRAKETCNTANMYEAITYSFGTCISYAPHNARAP